MPGRHRLTDDTGRREPDPHRDAVATGEQQPATPPQSAPHGPATAQPAATRTPSAAFTRAVPTAPVVDPHGQRGAAVAQPHITPATVEQDPRDVVHRADDRDPAADQPQDLTG